MKTPQRISTAAIRDVTMMRIFACVVAIATLDGCVRGLPSDKPPIHPNPNMDRQEKYKAQSESKFFADHATMRTPPPGTVAFDQLRDDDAYYTGKVNGKLVKTSPVPLTLPLLKRGQERYQIYCLPCHGGSGAGNGIIVQRGLLPPPSYHEQRLRDTADGHFFDVMTNGVRNMSSYASQIPVADRWAIVAYIRALQRSQNATIKDVPADKRETVQ